LARAAVIAPIPARPRGFLMAILLYLALKSLGIEPS